MDAEEILEFAGEKTEYGEAYWEVIETIFDSLIENERRVEVFPFHPGSGSVCFGLSEYPMGGIWINGEYFVDGERKNQPHGIFRLVEYELKSYEEGLHFAVIELESVE